MNDSPTLVKMAFTEPNLQRAPIAKTAARRTFQSIFVAHLTGMSMIEGGGKVRLRGVPRVYAILSLTYRRSAPELQDRSTGEGISGVTREKKARI